MRRMLWAIVWALTLALAGCAPTHQTKKMDDESVRIFRDDSV